MKSTPINSMAKDSRLLVKLRFADNSERGWGYDYPHYPTAEYLQQNLEEDFYIVPDNEEIHLSYAEYETIITADSGVDLAHKTIDWLQSTGDFY